MATRRTTRTLEDQTASDGEMKEILTTISSKLDTINDSLNKMIDNQRNCNEARQETSRNVAASINKIQESVSEVIKHSKATSRSNEISKQRRSISQTWNNHLNKRKQLYWHSLNSENTAIIHETWINKEKKIIPRKFLMKHIRDETEEEKNIRQNLVVEKFQAEIEMLKIRANRHQAKYRQVDQEMNDLLEKQFDENTAGELEALWIAECKKEEVKSQDRWQTKQQWLEKYEESFTNNDFVKSRENKARNSDTCKAFQPSKKSAITAPRAQQQQQEQQRAKQQNTSSRRIPTRRNAQFEQQSTRSQTTRPSATRGQSSHERLPPPTERATNLPRSTNGTTGNPHHGIQRQDAPRPATYSETARRSIPETRPTLSQNDINQQRGPTAWQQSNFLSQRHHYWQPPDFRHLMNLQNNTFPAFPHQR